MHVQVLKRYRDRDTKIIHEAGELVAYDNIPRIITLARGGYVEPLEPLPADTVEIPVITHGFVQVIDPKGPASSETTEGGEEPNGKKKGGRPTGSKKPAK